MFWKRLIKRLKMTGISLAKRFSSYCTIRCQILPLSYVLFWANSCTLLQLGNRSSTEKEKQLTIIGIHGQYINNLQQNDVYVLHFNPEMLVSRGQATSYAIDFPLHLCNINTVTVHSCAGVSKSLANLHKTPICCCCCCWSHSHHTDRCGLLLNDNFPDLVIKDYLFIQHFQLFLFTNCIKFHCCHIFHCWHKLHFPFVIWRPFELMRAASKRGFVCVNLKLCH